MLKLAFIALFLSAPVTHPKSDTPASSVFIRQRILINQMNVLYPSVDVTVVWAPCGQENALYFPESKTILLCTELEQIPDAALGVAAHEMAHAITHQLTGVSDEQDADEVAALAMIRLGYQDEVMALANWFLTFPEQGHERGDPHPGARFRAWEFACIESGSEGWPTQCVVLYFGLKVLWEHRLHEQQVD